MKFRVLLTGLILVPLLALAEEQTSEQLYQEAYDNFVKRDYTAASASLDKINPVDQKKADILNLRGAIYKRLGELDNAANAYADALKINPKDWVPKYNLAEVNFLRGQYKPSRTYLEQALASMPEADRLQKQDLILYKVYLTYLLQGDEEKAKLLLDSFDINSSNPVYYFAQAAWSYKKKDPDKAKTWINSTDGLYSQDLRNSYGQALVDVGWLEPSVGVGATSLTATNATPAPSPEMVATATASPTPPTPNSASVVPLATNDATPIAVVEPSATPAVTVAPDATPSATVPVLPAVAEKKEDSGNSTMKITLIILGILGVAIWLINLAKRSRIVPPPEDNTGYDAIVASGNPEVAGSISHTSEGTGIVLEQDDNGNTIPPASIKVSPIHREYANDESMAAVVSPAPESTRITRQTTHAAQGTRTKPSPKTVMTSKTKTAVSPKKTPAKVPVKTVASKSAPVTPAAKTPARKTPAVAGKPAAKAPATAQVSAAITPVKVAPKTSKPVAKTTSKAAPAIAKPAAESAAPPRRQRLVPIPTISVPAPEVPPAKIMVSNIETIKLSATKAEAPVTPAPEKAPKAPVKAKVPVKAKAPAKPKTAPKPAAKTTAPLITIPEFEDSNMESPSNTVIRLVPETTHTEEEPKNN